MRAGHAQRQPGGDGEAAVRGRAEGEGAAAGGDPLGDAGQAVARAGPSRGQPDGPGRTGLAAGAGRPGRCCRPRPSARPRRGPGGPRRPSRGRGARALVSASCTIRYAVRSMPGGSAASEPETWQVTGRPASRAASISSSRRDRDGTGVSRARSGSGVWSVNRSTPSRRRSSVIAVRAVDADQVRRRRGGSPGGAGSSAPTASACTAIRLTWCATTSCSSRAIRSRSAAAAPAAASSSAASARAARDAAAARAARR